MSNIEDDVKIVKRYLENSSYKESNSDFFKNGGWEIVDLEIPQAMSNIMKEREQDKARIKELENRLRDINTYILINSIDEPLKTATQIKVENQQQYIIQEKINLLKKKLENSIPKQKVKDVLQNNRNEIFSFTYVDDEQFKPYTMQIDRINKIEKELLEEGE